VLSAIYDLNERIISSDDIRGVSPTAACKRGCVSQSGSEVNFRDVKSILLELIELDFRSAFQQHDRGCKFFRTIANGRAKIDHVADLVGDGAAVANYISIHGLARTGFRPTCRLDDAPLTTGGNAMADHPDAVAYDKFAKQYIPANDRYRSQCGWTPRKLAAWAAAADAGIKWAWRD
jgi:hypothetical protein